MSSEVERMLREMSTVPSEILARNAGGVLVGEERRQFIWSHELRALARRLCENKEELRAVYQEAMRIHRRVFR